MTANKTIDPVSGLPKEETEEPFAHGPYPEDLPTKEQREQLEGTVKKLLNPEGKNPQLEGYVTSTFDYIQRMLEKMANSGDKEATATEIAGDLQRKFDGWAKEKQRELKANKTGSEASGTKAVTETGTTKTQTAAETAETSNTTETSESSGTTYVTEEK